MNTYEVAIWSVENGDYTKVVVQQVQGNRIQLGAEGLFIQDDQRNILACFSEGSWVYCKKIT